MPRKAYFISKDWKNSIVSREWRGLRMETKTKYIKEDMTGEQVRKTKVFRLCNHCRLLKKEV